ncbi:hypothetical protein Q1695_007428 [Nippostrongylus brasiliensis]|nr:hypothetical protein Q1695_007428 [Nippostrongylus brasiliensis]
MIDNVQHNYYNTYHVFNNFFTITATTVIYAACCLKMFRHSSLITHKLNKFEVEVYAQSLVICALTTIECFLFIYTQYFPSPPWFSIVTMLGWQICSGLGGIICIIANRTVRKAVIRQLQPGKSSERSMKIEPRSASVINQRALESRPCQTQTTAMPTVQQ